MFHSICKQLVISRKPTTISNIKAHSLICSNVWFHQTQSLSSTNEKSLTVPYLIDTFGYSLESATKVSRHIKITSIKDVNSVVKLFRTYGFTNAHFLKRPSLTLAEPNNANNVLEFLKTYSFSDAQISASVTRLPSLLFAKPDETIKPKFDYFISLGMSVLAVAKLVSNWPHLLSRDLDTQIIPTCNFIKTIVYTDSKLIAVLKNNSFILSLNNIEEVIRSNILILQDHGVPNANISRFLKRRITMTIKSVRLEISILKAKRMGFDPETIRFVEAVSVLASVGESAWRQKMEVYKSFGCSEEEIILAFTIQPGVMLTSPDKIKCVLNFFLKTLGWGPSFVSKYPKLVCSSLEKRIIPRCSVLNILFSKGALVKEDLNIQALLIQNELVFLKRFILKYQAEIPEIVEAHQGKIAFEGFATN